jgi:asparagine synthase (glutamine-hydrolysing)
VPIRVWLREDKYYNIVKDKFTGTAARKFFNCDILMKLLDDHKNGKCDNSRKIWTIFIFLVWYGVYFEGSQFVK